MHNQVADKKQQLSALQSLRDALETEAFKKFESNRTGFNIFKALGVGDYEIRHSNMLAWLMDPHEKHNLKGWFQKSIVLKIQKANPERYDCLSVLTDNDFASSCVRREEEYRDIQIEFPNAKIVLVIENKWNAGESEGDSDEDGQLKKYKRAIDSQFGDDWQRAFVFLTPEGRPPSRKNQADWGVLGYGAVREILVCLLNGKFVAEDMSIKTFIEHYKAIIEERIGCMNSEEEKLCEEIYTKHHEAIELVLRHHNEIRDWLIAKLRDGIAVKSGRLECSPELRYESYIQYNRRFPANKTNSVHYEILTPRGADYFRLYVHVEKGTDETIINALRDEICSKAEKTPNLTSCKNGAETKKVVWANRNFDEVYSEICQKMELLYTTFEPIIAKYEKHK